MDKALLNVNIRRAVFAHRAELDQPALGNDASDCPQDVQGARDVIHLSERRAIVVNHGVRSGRLFAVVHNCVGPEFIHHSFHDSIIPEVPDKQFDFFAGDLFPCLYAIVQRANGDQRLDVQLHFPSPLRKIVDHGECVPATRQIHRCRPA